MNYKLLPLALLLLVSCGQKQQAKDTVKTFVKENIADSDHYSFKDFGRLDSTRYVTDSIIGVMRACAAKDNTFRKPTTYGQRTNNEQLKYIKVKMTVAEQDTMFTFYLTNDVMKVVAVK